ncbi:alpha/beta hydrolase [Risungbinella massiliensis]|uniref:alpha/beta hydrolase n=1 Tax=Risungbinella massiliensis TaxID=1329796 RepID=UPI0005CC48E0|nr:alpha/beta hydrolase [Risungbinella massiliensis]
MSMVENGMLLVPGASLYYEVRGAGPVLLMIHGGGGDADKFLRVANHLANWYTVVTYDRRGHSRSSLVDRTEEYRLETHSDDAHRLLANLTDEPAYIFGSSSGACIGLDLSIMHPEQVRILIPHEPVLLQLLFGNDQIQARKSLEDLQENIHRELQDFQENLCREGVFSAVMKLSSNLGIDSSNQSNVEQMERIVGNLTYFITYEVPGIRSLSFDIDALKTVLKSSAMRVIPTGGSDSRGLFPFRCTVALAEQLGTEIVEFPSHHGGYNTIHHKVFAERLHDVLVNGSMYLKNR